jgi:hypothetical protein
MQFCVEEYSSHLMQLAIAQPRTLNTKDTRDYPHGRMHSLGSRPMADDATQLVPKILSLDMEWGVHIDISKQFLAFTSLMNFRVLSKKPYE